MRNKKGFTLMELIVVIAIMVVMMGVLAPSLIGYAEKTRADKDTSQMQEVVTAIEMAMTNQEIYDDLLLYALENNYSCYIDGDPTTNAVINRKEDFDIGNAEGVVGGEDLWSYGDDARALPKVQYQASGKMCGVTITFVHNYDTDIKDFDVGNALINNMGPDYKKGNAIKLKDLTTDGNTYLYNYLTKVVAEKITTTSSRYQNSEYTVFIRMVPPGVDYNKYKALTVDVYGQWNGTNLMPTARRNPLNETDGAEVIIPGNGETPATPIPVRPGISDTPQTPKDVATFIAPTMKSNLVYTGYALELINTGSSTEGTMYYKLEGQEWSTQIPTALNAGLYDVFYYVKGDENHYNTQIYSLTVSVAKANPQYTVPTGQVNLKANGQSYPLLNPGQVINGGTMEYRLETTGYTAAVPTGKAPGNYRVYWRITETDNYVAWPETLIEVSIDKMAAGVQPPVAKDLTYTGALLDLIEPCTITNDSMPDNLPIIEYSLDGTTWSTSIPYGKAAGEYTVYYRVNANRYYSGTDGTDNIKVTIKKADPNVEIQWNDSLSYTSSALSFVDDVKKDSDKAVFFRAYKAGATPGEFSTAYPSATNAGEYVIEWYISEHDNYANNGTKDAPNQKTIIIEKAQAADTNKITVKGENWIYDKSTRTVSVGNATGWNIVFKDNTGKVIDGIPSITDASSNTYTWTAEHENFKTEQGSVALICEKAPVKITRMPQGDTRQGSGIIIVVVNKYGQELRREFTPISQTLSASITPGTCTEGGTFTYTGPQNINRTFMTANGSDEYSMVCNWEVTPMSSNYYIEGTSSGQIRLRLVYVVSTSTKTEG